MDRTFPIGFPAPTAVYLVLYVVTLVVHVVFMNYVLAGAAYLFVAGIGRGRDGRSAAETSVVADLLRDWLPFALGLAITGGVAPLLFVQILYKANFYTANLLLLHRWMAIVPVLIVGFYLMYVMKTDWFLRRGVLVRRLVALLAFVCVAFTGWSWVENHLLSLDARAWPVMYGERSIFYAHPVLVPRLMVLAFGALPTMAVLVAWQALAKGRWLLETAGPLARRLAAIAVIGMAGVAAGCVWYLSAADPLTRQVLTGRLVGGYLVLGLLGVAMQIAAWALILQRRALSPARLAAASIGLVLTILGMTVVREGIRLAHLDISLIYGQHEEALQRGGFWIFAGFMVINAGMIAWAIRIGRRGTPAPVIADASAPAPADRRDAAVESDGEQLE